MAVIPKELVHPVKLTSSPVTYYTAYKCRTIIDKCTIHSHDTVNRNVIISIVSSGGDVSESILVQRSIAPGETYLCPEVVGHDLDSQSTIVATCEGEGSFVDLRVSGREITGI